MRRPCANPLAIGVTTTGIAIQVPCKRPRYHPGPCTDEPSGGGILPNYPQPCPTCGERDGHDDDGDCKACGGLFHGW